MRSPAHCTSCCASVGAGFYPARGRGNRRSAAGGGRSEAISRKCPDWRPRQWPGIGWHDGGQESPSPTLFFVTQHRRGGRPCPPAEHFPVLPVKNPSLRGRNAPVAIRTPVPKVLPPFTLHATQKSHRINPIRWLSLFHFCAEFSGRHWPFIIRTAACRASARCSAICARFTSRSALCSASRSRARFSADWARGRSMSSARSAARTSSVTSL